jgi:hypothetical protein
MLIKRETPNKQMKTIVVAVIFLLFELLLKKMFPLPFTLLLLLVLLLLFILSSLGVLSIAETLLVLLLLFVEKQNEFIFSSGHIFGSTLLKNSSAFTFSKSSSLK